MSIENRILRITFFEDKIFFVKSGTSFTEGPLNSDGIQLELRVSSIFHKALNKTRVDGIFEKNDFEFLGNILFRILCLENQKDARDFVYNELSFVLRERTTRGLVILEFKDEVTHLAELPWEYLQIKKNFDKGIEPFYLGAMKDKKFDLVRFINYEQQDDKDYSPRDNDTMTVLSFVSSPIGQDVRKVDKDVLENSFHSLEKEFNKDGEKRFEWMIKEAPNENTFFKELKDASEQIDGPYILHFYGHARMDHNGPEIAFVDPQTGKAEWVKSSMFENYFAPGLTYKRPAVVVFQACESGQINATGEGFGIGLIRKGIPFVVAMQNEVTPDTTTAFCEIFYRSLLSGHDIFKAVTDGRAFLGCTYGKKNPDVDQNDHYNNNSFGTPVIFSSTARPIRFFSPAEEEKQKRAQMNMICLDCNAEYPYDASLKFCLKDRCRGKLEPKSRTSVSVRSSRVSMQEQGLDALK